MAPESPESQAEELVLALPEQWAWDSVQGVLHGTTAERGDAGTGDTGQNTQKAPQKPTDEIWK